MRPAVHPDRATLHVRADEHLVGDDLLRGRVLLFPDSKLQRSPVDVSKIVRLALMFEKIHATNVPRFCVPAAGFVDGDSSEVSINIARNAVSLILVVPAGPLPDDVELGVSRCTDQQSQK